MKRTRTLAAAMLLLWASSAWADPGPATRPGDRDGRVTPVVLAYQKARPAVVSISAEKVITAQTGLFGGDPFEDIFPSPVRRVPVQSLGSGVILHPSGYVATNAHVVRCAEKITLTLSDKTQLPAHVLVADPDNDLAVLKIDPPKAGEGLPFLPLGRSDDLMVGETVVAIGNPMGYSNSVTTGVVSAVDRTMEFPGGVVYKNLIQTDAPINPGNSGGPLLNIHGELIGINTAIQADAQNIGFAIPVDRLAEHITSLLDFERINRVVFGAAVGTRHGEGGDEVYVTAVRKGTPAEPKFQAGDRLVSLNGRPVRQVVDYACAMLEAKPAAKMAFTVLRQGKEVGLELALLERPRPDGKALAQGLMGLSLKPVTPELARDMALRVDCGLMVVGLDGRGPADRLGVRLKDVIFQIDRFLVDSNSDLGAVLEDVKPGQTLRLGLVRQNVRAWVPITTRAQLPATAPASQPATQPRPPAPKVPVTGQPKEQV